tara:strand:+ start:2067 stop:2969 length:903 start_codon:yes stop_codon:yes gene_type:complete
MTANISDILSNAFSHSIAISLFNEKNKELIPHNLFNFFKNKINPNTILDKDLVKRVELHNNINWDIIEKNKAIRVLSRDVSLFERIDIEKLEISTADLYPIFIQHPELIHEFVKDFDKITPLEAIRLLECNEDLIDYIDISKYKFSKKDMMEMVKKFRTSVRIMERLDLESLEHYSTRKLLCRTGVDYIDRLNISQLKASDWLEVLEQHPNLLEYCDLNIFEKNDCYLLTKLAIKFPELDYLIIKNSDKISALGWENLIKEDLDRYEEICKWEKFTESNWIKVIKKHPHLSSLKQKYYIF